MICHFNHKNHWPIFSSNGEKSLLFIIRNPIKTFVVFKSVHFKFVSYVISIVNQFTKIDLFDDFSSFGVDLNYVGGKVDIGPDISINEFEFVYHSLWIPLQLDSLFSNQLEILIDI